MKRVLLNFLWRMFPGGSKEEHELIYWKNRVLMEGRLSNEHYVEFFCDHFGIDKEFYRGKNILDIGCGPRGSLEWADVSELRIGLDPLASEYIDMGIRKHHMQYVASRAEAIPLQDNIIDVITSFNSLDHVDDLESTISEIKRVLRSEGLFLLLTDVNHEATHCEPQEFTWDIADRFMPEFSILEDGQYERNAKGLYESIREGIPFDTANKVKRYGVLSAKFVKVKDSNSSI